MGYRYFNTFGGEVASPFGYGLSYTTFKYCEPEVKMTKDGFTARVTVTNTGSVAGKEAVQLYVTAPSGGMEKPRCELKSFAKTKLLEPGESQTLEFTVDSYSLASFNEGSGRWESASGTYTVHFAANVEDIRCSVPLKLPKMKVLILTEKPFAPAAVAGIREILEGAGHEVATLEKYTERAQALEAVKDANALIIRSDKVTAEVLDAAKNLKIVVRAGAGYDNLDLEACTAKGIIAMNTPGQNSNAVAELVMGLLVFCVRNFYNGKSGSELMGKKLGLLAYGNVGRNVARIAKGFGMDVYAFDAFLTAEQIEADGVAHAVANQAALFETCNVVSLHIPATAETKNSINYELVNKMPKGGILVNTARKEVINEAELLKLMADRTDLRYISDIMPDADAEFKAFEGRYFATPKKMGAQTEEANINAGIAAANQISNYFATGCTKFQVNK